MASEDVRKDRLHYVEEVENALEKFTNPTRLVERGGIREVFPGPTTFGGPRLAKICTLFDSILYHQNCMRLGACNSVSHHSSLQLTLSFVSVFDFFCNVK